MISLVCFGLCLVLFVSGLPKRADLFSPVRVFGLTWAFALGLTELKLSAFQSEWSLTSWLLVLIGPISFLIGNFVAQVGNLQNRLRSLEEMRKEIKNHSIDEERLFLALCIGFSLYFSSYLISFLVKGFVPLFSMKGASSRGDFGVFGLGILVHSVPFILFFSTLYYIMVRKHKTKKAVLMILSAIMAVTFLFLLQRFQFIMSFVVCVVLIYYTTHRIKVRTVLTSIVTVLALFYFVSTLRSGELFQSYLFKMSKMKVDAGYMILTEPYMYFVMNLENFARGVERLDSYTFGYYTFDFLLALGGIKHWISEYFQLDPELFLVSTYNTYTGFWTYYRDYGVLGIAGIPFLMGFTIGSTYCWMRVEPTVSKVAAYCIMVFVMFISFFNSPIGFLWFAYNMMAFAIFLKLVYRPPMQEHF